MYPLLKQNQTIFCISSRFFNLKLDDIIVFNHPKEGLMIKKLVKIDQKKGYYVKGTSPFSIDSSVFGYLKKEDILYKMFFKF